MAHQHGEFREGEEDGILCAYPWSADEHRQESLNEPKWKLRNFHRRVSRLAFPPVRHNQVPGDTEIADFKSVKDGDFVRFDTLIFSLSYVSSEGSNAWGTLVYQVELNNVMDVQDGRPNEEYTWFLKCGDIPRLLHGHPNHYEGLERDEITAMECMYMKTKDGETQIIRKSANQYGPTFTPTQYPIDWTCHVYYNVKLDEGQHGTCGGDYKLTVLGRVKMTSELTHRSSKADKTRQQMVMHSSGLIFEMTPSGNRLFAIFDAAAVKLERIYGSHHLWTPRFECSPLLKITPMLNKLTKPEFDTLLEYRAVTPISDRPQLFAIGKQAPTRYKQDEDMPASGIFGPNKNWTGKFSRSGKSFIQDGRGESSRNDILMARRFEIVPGGRQAWHVASRRHEFWIPETVSVKYNFRKKPVGYDFSLFVIGIHKHHLMRRIIPGTLEYGPVIKVDFAGEEVTETDDEPASNHNEDDSEPPSEISGSETAEEVFESDEIKESEPEASSSGIQGVSRATRNKQIDFKEISSEAELISDDEPELPSCSQAKPIKKEKVHPQQQKPKPAQPKETPPQAAKKHAKPKVITVSDSSDEEPMSARVIPPARIQRGGTIGKPGKSVNRPSPVGIATGSKAKESAGAGSAVKRPNQSVGSYSAVLSQNATPTKKTQAKKKDHGNSSDEV